MKEFVSSKRRERVTLPAMATLNYKDVIRITTNLPAQRTRKDILAVCDWIQKVTPLFADIDRDIVYNVMKSCKCQILVRDTVVVRQGERGNAFYIILRGQVSVFVKEDDRRSLLQELLESDEECEKSPTPEETVSVRNSDEEDETESVRLPSVRQRFRKSLTKLKITQVISSKTKKEEKKPDPREKLGVKVAQMKDGESFGELALQNSDNRREASCVTDTEVVFLVVPKELYNKSIKSHQAKQLALIKGFINEHPMFSHWPGRLQTQVQNSVIQKKLQDGNPIIRQGQACNGLHFLVQGEVKVIVNTQNHSKQYAAKSAKEVNLDMERKLEDTNLEQRMLGQSEILRALSVPHVHVKRRRGYCAAELYQSNRQRNLCLSGPTIMFGDLEHVLGVHTYMQTIIAKGPVKILHINKENLARLLKLATLAGPATSDTTLTAMTEVAFETWVNRIEKFATPNDDFSCLDQMVRDLSKHPTMRLKPTDQEIFTKEDQQFHSLFKAYVKNQAPLILPCVRDGYSYRVSMQEKAKHRQLQREKYAKRGGSKTKKPLRPLQTIRAPRSIAALKEQIRIFQTSDANIIVPPRKEIGGLEPLKNRHTVEKDTRAKSMGDLESMDKGEFHRANLGMNNLSRSTVIQPGYARLVPVEGNREKISHTRSIVGSEAAERNLHKMTSSSPGVLVTEVNSPKGAADSNCEQVDLVEGKTLKFYSQYLRRRLEREYDKELVEPEIYQNNKEADILEKKLRMFIDPYDTLPESTTAISKFKRLDETTKANLLPGGKCLVERRPCKLLQKAFPFKAHEHVHRHIVAHEE